MIGSLALQEAIDALDQARRAPHASDPLKGDLDVAFRRHWSGFRAKQASASSATVVSRGVV